MTPLEKKIEDRKKAIEECARVADDFIRRHENAEDLKLWPVREVAQAIRKLGESNE